MKKILLATIVPFWNRETGAQQRIFALVKALEHHGHLVRVFFPGHADAADHEIAERSALDVAFHSSDQPLPTDKSLAQKLKWQFDAVVHALSNQEPDAPHDTPLRLSDFAWPWAEKAFEHAVTQFAPDAIICEYITMAYLVDALPKSLRSNIHCLVDTHDVLSQRQKQFADHHKTHWIDISIEEEAAALHCFDTIIAIQPDEAKQIEQMAPDSKVIVAGHQPHGTATANSQPANPNRELGKLTIGYLGSANASNVDAINHFLDEVWRQQKDASDIRLVIAGNVSDQVLEDLRFDNVQLLGKVSDVAQFYDIVDAVINPVGYGTGLKIKSVEAIAYRKPLLCTSQGWVGKLSGGVTVVKQVKDMTHVIDRWKNDNDTFQKARLAVDSSSLLHSDQVYAALLKTL